MPYPAGGCSRGNGAGAASATVRRPGWLWYRFSGVLGSDRRHPACRCRGRCAGFGVQRARVQSRSMSIVRFASIAVQWSWRRPVPRVRCHWRLFGGGGHGRLRRRFIQRRCQFAILVASPALTVGRRPAVPRRFSRLCRDMHSSRPANPARNGWVAGRCMAACSGLRRMIR